MGRKFAALIISRQEELYGENDSEMSIQKFWVVLLCFFSLTAETAPVGEIIRAVVHYTEGLQEKTGYERELTEEYQIEDFPIVLQMPELPTGCEITALTMVLNYYGYSVDKVSMASNFLPLADGDLYYGENGKLYGPDMNRYFVGNPFSEGGIICGTQAIVTAADTYLHMQESSYGAKDITGSSVDALYNRVSQNQPVIVWVTIGMEDRNEVQGWYTENGSYVEWSTNDHGAVLIGYTDTTVMIADPVSGRMTYNRAQFEKVFMERGSKCVVIA